MLITTDYPPDMGGVAWYYYCLVNKVGKFEGFKESRIEVLKLGRWALKQWWPLMLPLLIIKSLITQSDRWWVGQVLPVGTVVWLLSFVWRKPYIVSTHGMDVLIPLRSRRKRWLVGKILERAELITANSEWTKRKIVENYLTCHSERNEVEPKNLPRMWAARMREGSLDRLGMTMDGEKVIVIFPEPKPKHEIAASEVNELRLKLGIPEGAKILLTVSRLVKRKGIDRVIAALPEVWKHVPDLHYVVVGEGEEKAQLEFRKKEMLRQAQHDNFVHFVGKVDDEELAVYYSMANAFILLPRDIDGDAEGFGIVYLEASLYGLPIIGTHSGGTSEALNQCSRVTIVNDPDNAGEIAQALWQQFQ